ncbi:MAG: transporter substrate-binding domain-containing protein [Lachnospiraceae bacterium]|nr:transporter substrate-binding domain-containing protein [Lachnospiraceae bacterium]
MKRHIRRIIFFSIILSIMSLFLVACSADLEKEKDNENEIMENDGVLKVGIDAAFPPYTYRDQTGELVGFDISLAREVCKRLNKELILIPINWDEKHEDLEKGKVDCIWSCFTITGREAEYTFTDPYVENGQFLVVLKNSNINTAEDLRGKNVAVQASTTAQDNLLGENSNLTQTFAHLYALTDNEMAFLYLNNGKVDAVLADFEITNYYMEAYPDQFRRLEIPLLKDQVGIGFKWGNTILRDEIQGALDNMGKDGTLQEIATEWDMEGSIFTGEDKGSIHEKDTE